MLSADATDHLAIGVLAMLAGALALAVARVYRAYRYTAWQLPLYMFSWFMCRVLWRAKVKGRINLADDEGAVIVSNHRGPIDPAFIGLATRRPVHWLVAREYFAWPVFGRSLRVLQAIPTGRGGVDTAAIRAAVRLAEQGELVGMFPEGRINNTDQLLLPGRPGAALVALKARVRVVPCYLSGSPYDGTAWGFLFLPAKTRLVVGRPIDISEYFGRESEKPVLEELTRRFLAEIARLAGHENFEPQLAGRRWLKEAPVP